MRYVIAYDISNDGVRARVAARLASRGDRIQWSVFECTLATDELVELQQQLEQLVDASHDSVHFIPVCAGCDDGRRLIGQATRPSRELWWVL